MLQQTLVATVIPYFERFLEAFPTIADLGRAEEQEVLRLWEGLGYYRRARHLLAAAKQICEDHEGQFPKDPKVVLGLPGFGRYTVGAVLSQAFDARLPILEANSIRLLTRFFGLRGDPKSHPLNAELWTVAETLLPQKRVGDFNQSLMELGALICTPNAPQCGECPLSKKCGAFGHDLQDQLPELAKPIQVTELHEVAVVLRKGGEVFLVQRPAENQSDKKTQNEHKTWWANMWEFPHATIEKGESVDDAARRILKELTGFTAEIGCELTTVKHGVTRYRIVMVCLEARYSSGEFRSTFYVAGEWVDPNDLGRYPLSSPQRKLAKLLEGPQQGRLF